MSKNKSYKKKKMKKTVNYKKLGIIAGVILAIALFVVIFINATKEEYYECTEYSWYEKVDSNEYNYEINQKEIYEFYRIFLEDDGTFELKFREANGTRLYTDAGTYEKTDTHLILTYTSASQEPSKVCTYTIDGDKLIREEVVQDATGQYVKVKQVFELE